ncbi:UTRA domain-containing protein [Bradyrhizobium sp. CCGUVB1N3]|uniref:UTRA domain-containing protein n=1 Tax=Bradyrhizobium sp. CCGUVB1N3 TaxID=2949629 RepID=UPI0020B3712D|nr:UTRA domain-containing protein [Bradyrhizobium sp. CCGUVB1N3]MCP3476754.1 UTRA domain-containing protein [Bradyrhizobium sp. CCGUVB1N3]
MQASDPIPAQQLKVHVGAPLLDLRRVSTDQNGEPFEYMKALAPPDRFRFDMTMQQDDSGDFTMVTGA